MKDVVRIISSRKTLIIAAVIIVSLIFAFAFKKDAPKTNASNASTKYYTCISVEEGDTLWDIAGEYMTEEYESRQAYIDEVISINNMNTDVIVEGTNLLVPYYEVKNFE